MKNPRTDAVRLINTLKDQNQKRFEKEFIIDGQNWYILVVQK